MFAVAPFRFLAFVYGMSMIGKTRSQNRKHSRC